MPGHAALAVVGTMSTTQQFLILNAADVSKGTQSGDTVWDQGVAMGAANCLKIYGS